MILVIFFLLFQGHGSWAQETRLLPSIMAPPLEKAACLLRSFQSQAQTHKNEEDPPLPARLTRDLYGAGRIVTGQGAFFFATDPQKYANAQERKLYLTIAVTLGIDLAARWKSMPYPDIAAYFEKSFGFKENYLQHLKPEELQNNRPHQHCFLMLLAALAGYETAETTPLSQTFIDVTIRYRFLQNMIMINWQWLAPLLNQIVKENQNLYSTLLKIYSRRHNRYYFLKEDIAENTNEKSEENALVLLPKPLHFTRTAPLTLTPLYPTLAKSLHNLLDDCAAARDCVPNLATKLRNYGFALTSLEEAQNIFLALWSYTFDKEIIALLRKGCDQALYDIFSKSQQPKGYGGISVILLETASFHAGGKDQPPLLFLQPENSGYHWANDLYL